MPVNQDKNIGGKQFGIIGNGSWATALAKILTDNSFPVNWWMRKKLVASHIATKLHNPDYLSSVIFSPDSIFPSTDLQQVIADSDILLLVTPSAFMGPLLEQLPKTIFKNKTVISAVKGILPERNDLINDYLTENFQFNLENYFAITGPCHAEEVAEEKLSYLTFSGLNKEKANAIAGCFSNDYIHTTITHDLWGSQYAAVLKNIYAIGAGMAHGAGYGDNFLSVYITNCYREMYQFLLSQFEKIHPSSEWPDFHTSAYLGDLLVTCYSPHSRNRTLGKLIGNGYSVKEANTEMTMIAEGYFAAKGIGAIIQKLEIKMPIIQAIYQVLWKEKNVEGGLEEIKKYLN